MIEVLLLALLIAVVAIGIRATRGLERTDHKLEALQQFLFVRLPTLRADQLDELTHNLVLEADFQALSTGKFVVESHFHPLRRLIDECILDAYRSSEQVLLTVGPFDQMPVEKQEAMVDYFWFVLPKRLRSALVSAGWLTLPFSFKEPAPPKAGPVEARVGDVIIEDTTRMRTPSPLSKPFSVWVVTSEGRQRTGDNLYTRSAAEGRALRLAQKHKGRVLSEESGGWWRVDVERAGPDS